MMLQSHSQLQITKVRYEELINLVHSTPIRDPPIGPTTCQPAMTAFLSLQPDKF